MSPSCLATPKGRPPLNEQPLDNLPSHHISSLLQQRNDQTSLLPSTSTGTLGSKRRTEPCGSQTVPPFRLPSTLYCPATLTFLRRSPDASNESDRCIVRCIPSFLINQVNTSHDQPPGPPGPTSSRTSLLPPSSPRRLATRAAAILSNLKKAGPPQCAKRPSHPPRRRRPRRHNGYRRIPSIIYGYIRRTPPRSFPLLVFLFLAVSL